MTKIIKKRIVKIATWCWATLPRKIISCLVITGLLLSSAWFLFFKPAPVEAGWFDQDWLYRRSVTVTNNTTAETNVYVEITSINTSDAGKLQADCGDLRFTKKDGTQLDYYIVSGCRTSSTIVHVKLDTLQAGAQTIYFYYGNSSAANGFVGADFSTVASNYSVGSIGSEEKGTGPVLWLKFDEGYGAFAYNSTENDAGKLPGTELDTAHPLANGLAGLWLMNENTGTSVADLSGNGNTGTITDATWTSSKFGSALDFDGDGDYIRTNNNIGISGSQNRTISVWFKTSDNSGGNKRLVTWGAGASYTEYALHTDGNNRFRIAITDGNRIWTEVYADNVWHHLVVVLNGTKTSDLTAYFDGTIATISSTNDQTIDTIDSVVSIGSSVGTANYFNGQIDNVKIYNRALSADEIAQLYREPFAMVSDTGASRISGASWTTSGKFNRALDFDGTDDVVTVIRDANVNLQNKTAYSISAWIYPNSDGENDVGEIIDKGTNTYIRVDSEGSDGYLDLEAKLDLASSDPTLNIANAVRINRWSHILLVWEDDDDDEFTIYVNGIDMGTSSGGSGAPADDSGNDLLIGGDTSSNFDGIIDEVIIYPYARSAVQAKRNYNQGAAARIGRDDSWLTDGLVGYWKMDESSWDGSANEVVDSSGAGNHGVRAGNATTASGKFGKGGTFDGTGDYVDVGDTSQTGIRTVSFWVNPDAVNVTEESLDLNGTAYVKITNGIVTAQGFTSPTIYVNGVVGSTVTTSWNLITITTSTGINASDLDIGRLEGSTEFDGNLDDVRIYNRVLSGFEVRRLYDWGPGPIAHWKFDKGSGTTAYDSSENSNDGTFQGDTSWKSAADCKYGNCLSFDGSGDYVDVGDVLDAHLNDITLSAWFKTDDGTTGAIVGKGYSVTSSGYKIRIDGSGAPLGRVRCQMADNSGNNDVDPVTSGSYSDGNWHHAVCVFDRDGNLQLYVDGVLKDSDDLTGLSAVDSDTGYPFQIGALRDGANALFNGQIDDVRIYDYALTQKQIIEVMMGGRPAITETTSSPGVTMGYWKFDEGYGTTAYDASGRSNNLTHSTEAYTMSGKFGKAWDGDGSKYLSIADDPDFDFTETEDFSISGWFKHSAISSSNDYIITKYESGGGYKIYMDSDGDIAFAIDDDGTWGPEDVVGDDQSRNYDDNTWHYFAAVKQGTSSIRLYVDGTEIDNDTSLTETGSLVNTDLLYVGIDSDASTGPFDGELDEIKIYRFALSPEEILLDYNKGKSVMMGAVGTESDGTTPSWSQSRAYCPPGFTGTCDPPVGEWKMDERTDNTCAGGTNDVCDTSGNTNDGAINGNPVWKGSADCKYNSCLSFDGDGDYVDAGQPNIGTGNITVSLFIKRKEIGRLEGIFISNDLILIIESSNRLAFFDKRQPSPTAYRFGDIYLVKDIWYNIVVTSDGTTDNTSKIYVNGVEMNGVYTGSVSGSSSNLIIGTRGSIYFNGLIDHVMIFDYAMTQEQIAWLYNRGKPVGHWKFDEGEGSTAYDSSENNKPGTLTNMETADWISGKYSSGLDFDGSNEYVDVGDTTQALVKSVSLWVKPDAVNVTEEPLDLNGTGYVRITNGTVTGEGFTSPTIYVNGRIGSTLTAGVWTHILITTGTGINASDLDIGRLNTSYFDGKIDEVKIYNYALTAQQVKLDYNQGAAIRFGE